MKICSTITRYMIDPTSCMQSHLNLIPTSRKESILHASSHIHHFTLLSAIIHEKKTHASPSLLHIQCQPQPQLFKRKQTSIPNKPNTWGERKLDKSHRSKFQTHQQTASPQTLQHSWPQHPYKSIKLGSGSGSFAKAVCGVGATETTGDSSPTGGPTGGPPPPPGNA